MNKKEVLQDTALRVIQIEAAAKAMCMMEMEGQEEYEIARSLALLVEQDALELLYRIDCGGAGYVELHEAAAVASMLSDYGTIADPADLDAKDTFFSLAEVTARSIARAREVLEAEANRLETA